MTYQNFIKSIKESYPSLDNKQIDAALDAVKKISKPEDIEPRDYYNYLAIHFLEALGNEFPSQEEIDAIEELLKMLFIQENWCGEIENLIYAE